MTGLFLRRSACLLAAAMLTPLPTMASNIPPFCAELLVPPATCDAEKALPCEGACPKDKSNSWSRQWLPYWDLCLAAKQKKNPALAKTQFMCGSSDPKLEVVFYNPVDRWICCQKKPFVSGADANDKTGVKPPRTMTPSEAK
jgi:hypothetical protein